MPETISILRARRKRRLTGQSQNAARRRNTALSAGMALSLAAAALILAAAFAYSNLTRGLPSVELLPRLLNPPDGLLLQPTRFYDRTSTHLLFTFSPGGSTRRYIPLAEGNPQHIPGILVETVIAMHDPQFWSHSGYVVSGTDQPDQHATIAQRLVSDLLLYDEPPSLKRALRERILAAQITARYGRTQVLEWYLNSVNFGRYAFGVDSAAELYFDKPADQLTLAETAILAGIIETPSLNPIDAPRVALQRGREVLRLLAALHIITEEAAAGALAQTPDIQFPPQAGSGDKSEDQPAAFVNLAISQLETQFPRTRLEQGGLTVITSLDYDLQLQASCAVEAYTARMSGLAESGLECEAARWLPSLPPGITVPESSASALILDPKSGQVLALVGETIKGQQTALLSAHDPGSSLDGFVYLTGFTRGLGPGSLVWDIPPQGEALPAPGMGFESIYHGPLRLRIALANDYRAPAETIKTQMGFENVMKTAASFGIPIDTPVNLLQLGGAYGVFATQGVYFGQSLGEDYSAVTVLRVEALDHSLWLDWTHPQARPVVSAGLAYLMTHTLSDESARWPSLGTPNVLEIGRPAAVKSGQTQHGLDAWTVGYTPWRVVAVWTGSLAPPALDEGLTGEQVSDERGMITPRLTSVLYSGLMQFASRELPPDDWAQPADVMTLNVCDPSGLLPGKECPEIVNEIFLVGNEPHELDHLYRKFSINRETGLLATVFTPPQLVEQRNFLVVPPEARAWAQSAGVPIPPDSYDAIQPPALNPDVNIRAPALFDEVSGVIEITGAAAGADFASYRVLAGVGLNPQEWIEIAQSTRPVTNGRLAEWDTQGLNGLYAVQLVVTRTDQRVDTAITQVTIKE